MSDCGCDVARDGLEDYLHDEVGGELRDQIDQHLSACPQCEQEWRAGVVLTKRLRGVCCETAPEALKVEIVARLERSDS